MCHAQQAPGQMATLCSEHAHDSTCARRECPLQQLRIRVPRFSRHQIWRPSYGKGKSSARSRQGDAEEDEASSYGACLAELKQDHGPHCRCLASADSIKAACIIWQRTTSCLGALLRAVIGHLQADLADKRTGLGVGGMLRRIGLASSCAPPRSRAPRPLRGACALADRRPAVGPIKSHALCFQRTLVCRASSDSTGHVHVRWLADLCTSCFVIF